MPRFPTVAVAAFSAALLAATGVQAQPQLVAATPAADSIVAKPTKIELQFSEKLVGKSSGAELIMTGMPGMAHHGPMKMNGIKSALGPDGKTLVITPKGALPAGDYNLNWHVTGSDSRQVAGSYAFKVK